MSNKPSPLTLQRFKFIGKMLKQLQPLHCYTQLFAAHPKYVQKKM
jgi:hypothetical protein